VLTIFEFDLEVLKPVIPFGRMTCNTFGDFAFGFFNLVLAFEGDAFPT
jgi:hypothetical protein